MITFIVILVIIAAVIAWAYFSSPRVEEKKCCDLIPVVKSVPSISVAPKKVTTKKSKKVVVKK